MVEPVDRFKMATVKPFPGEGAYAAAMGGLNALTRHRAKGYGGFGVRVNAARMGGIGCTADSTISTAKPPPADHSM